VPLSAPGTAQNIISPTSFHEQQDCSNREKPPQTLLYIQKAGARAVLKTLVTKRLSTAFPALA